MTAPRATRAKPDVNFEKEISQLTTLEEAQVYFQEQQKLVTEAKEAFNDALRVVSTANARKKMAWARIVELRSQRTAETATQPLRTAA